MEKTIVFCDDNDSACAKYVGCLQEYENVECKKSSTYSQADSIELGDRTVGFIFSGTKEKVPKEIKHVISVLNGDRPRRCFVIITGGKRELGALKMILKQLDDREFHVMYMFSPFFITMIL